jgi:hypothetical protein
MKRWVNRDNGFWQSLKKYGELDSGKIVVFCSGYNVLISEIYKREA